jgi:dihydrofolate reductase
MTVELNVKKSTGAEIVRFPKQNFNFCSRLSETFPEPVKQKCKQLHQNINFLLTRAKRAIEFEDYPLVLLSCSSIFECIAKLQTKKRNITFCSLMQFWDEFTKQSTLPEFVLTLMKKIYKIRNREALAAHGNLYKSEFKKTDAEILLSITTIILSYI